MNSNWECSYLPCSLKCLKLDTNYSALTNSSHTHANYYSPGTLTSLWQLENES